MAYDKAVDSAVLDSTLTAIADAIREKGGTTDPITFDAMAAAVEAIEAGGLSVDLPSGYDFEIGTVTNAEDNHKIIYYLQKSYSSIVGVAYIAINSEEKIGQVFAHGGINCFLGTVQSSRGFYVNASGTVANTPAAYDPKVYGGFVSATASSSTQKFYLAGLTYLFVAVGKVG